MVSWVTIIIKHYFQKFFHLDGSVECYNKRRLLEIKLPQFFSDSQTFMSSQTLYSPHIVHLSRFISIVSFLGDTEWFGRYIRLQNDMKYMNNICILLFCFWTLLLHYWNRNHILDKNQKTLIKYVAWLKQLIDYKNVKSKTF